MIQSFFKDSLNIVGVMVEYGYLAVKKETYREIKEFDGRNDTERLFKWANDFKENTKNIQTEEDVRSLIRDEVRSEALR